jgi:S-adenosylmethionine synthetase
MASSTREGLFTSESVTEGHPDKICDQVSDAIVDAVLEQDPTGRVAAEAAVTRQRLWLFGEISSQASVDYEQIARALIARIGYTDPELGFSADEVQIETVIGHQSPDIARGVDESLETRGQPFEHDQGAGDQGLMFGYACRETPELMPLPIALAHRLAQDLATARRDGRLPYLRPDGKTQVSVVYEQGRSVALDTVLVSAQHDPDISLERLRADLTEAVIDPLIPGLLRRRRPRILVNPTGRFVLGGPAGDSGLTGRKIIVDTYGGYACHGGGCFSGKDPSKVDRSGAYAARWVAKHLVAANLAEQAEVQISYAIGVAHPVSVALDTGGSGVLDDAALLAAVREVFDLRPAAITEALQLRQVKYLPVAAYGHFGRPELDLPWERTDRVDELTWAAGRPRSR